eukprot:TRINITY_DN8404_c0_g1_i2.p1 TRINITY_DN8404_c0_g1~~TRINITY_DN8404_c0_g1_i2.p1  ORF type:complete len:268 (-),score=57.94 TRINITY_DN8404_c0_g1_i2:51-854(-)
MAPFDFGSSFYSLAVAAAGGALVAVLVSRKRAGSVVRGEEASAAAGTVIIVPGGGLTLEGAPTAWVRRRLQEAAAIYKQHRDTGDPAMIITLSGGTPHKPMPIDPKSKFQVMEAEGNAKCLIRDFSVPPEHILEECWSLDTIGNAYLARAIHTDVAGFRRIIVVNNEFHMPRTKAIFEKVFSLAPMPSFGAYCLEFVEVPNDGVEGEVLQSRKDREAKSTVSFKKNTATMGTMREMHSFVFSQHMAYASARLVKDREPVDPKALQTY